MLSNIEGIKNLNRILQERIEKLHLKRHPMQNSGCSSSMCYLDHFHKAYLRIIKKKRKENSSALNASLDIRMKYIFMPHEYRPVHNPCDT